MSNAAPRIRTDGLYRHADGETLDWFRFYDDGHASFATVVAAETPEELVAWLHWDGNVVDQGWWSCDDVRVDICVVSNDDERGVVEQLWRGTVDADGLLLDFESRFAVATALRFTFVPVVFPQPTEPTSPT